MSDSTGDALPSDFSLSAWRHAELWALQLELTIEQYPARVMTALGKLIDMTAAEESLRHIATIIAGLFEENDRLREKLACSEKNIEMLDQRIEKLNRALDRAAQNWSKLAARLPKSTDRRF